MVLTECSMLEFICPSACLILKAYLIQDNCFTHDKLGKHESYQPKKKFSAIFIVFQNKWPRTCQRFQLWECRLLVQFGHPFGC
ncbi:hypothetical protein M5K25_005225 [Dendrobium thyrsiflorum]|uniref:Uncharacterized protein n=1 Tax=Dendrobium thyrsiflorum TaxID=117978 RepID=A0ABD0VGX0_DENTH